LFRLDAGSIFLAYMSNNEREDMADNWTVHGTNADTGEYDVVEVLAESEQEALAKARAMGVQGKQAQLVPEPQAVNYAAPAVPDPANTERAQLHRAGQIAVACGKLLFVVAFIPLAVGLFMILPGAVAGGGVGAFLMGINMILAAVVLFAIGAGVRVLGQIGLVVRDLKAS
jgi:hypothetical protein